MSNDRALVNAGSLVGTLELQKGISIPFVVIISSDYNCISINKLNSTCILCQNYYSGVSCCLVFHSGTYYRGFGYQKRNRLTLHVGTHEGTVCVVVFQERNHCCCNGYYLLR